MDVSLAVTGLAMAAAACLVRLTLGENLAKRRALHDPSAWRLSVFMWGLPVYVVIAIGGVIATLIDS